MKMDSIAVRMEDVSKFYKLYDSPKARFKEALDPFRRSRHQDFYALHSINLEVRKGEILGVVGRNGSGKSTLLKLLAGVIPPSSGRLTVSGSVSAMLELGSGLNPDLNGIDNIYFGGILLGFSREEMKSRMDEIVAFADIGEFIHQPLKTYSSGMRARLGFALAVSIQPDILVVDEVLAVGDDLFKRKCFAKMEELFQTGCTVFFVSHSLPNIIEICTRAILLDQGEIILDGPPSFVTRYYQQLLYALPPDQEKIRTVIIRLNNNREEKEKYILKALQAEEPQGRKMPDVLSGPSQDRAVESPPVAFFMSDFTAKTTSRYDSEEAEISNIRISTLSGRIVNALVMNEEYLLSFTAHFRKALTKVRFVSAFQNVKGLVISGYTLDLGSVAIAENSVHSAQIRFRCTMLPGTYYANVALTRMNENAKLVRICGVHDALAFKVQAEKKKAHWGLVNLGQTGWIEKKD